MRWHTGLLTAAASAAVLVLTTLVGVPHAAVGPVTTAVGDGGTLHFTAAGDYAATVETSAVLTSMAARQPDLNLALGDLSYGSVGGEQAWCDFVTQRVGAGFPFQLLAGNHESNGQNGHINDFSACLPNQLPGLVGTYGRQWYVDVPQENPLVRFVMISPTLAFPDGTYTYAPGTPRYTWTVDAIDGARAAAIPWVVVGVHKPCLSMGQYACDIGRDLHDMLVAKRVDLILNGHEHLYQRTHQLAIGAGACPGIEPGTFTEACIADRDATMVKGAGSVVATVGTGGVGLRPVAPDDPEAGYFAAASGSGTPTWGVLDVHVTPTQLRGGFVPAVGTFTDAFTITDGPPPPNAPPVAAFTARCDGLACSVDGSGSTDSDGSVVSHVWTFDDGTSRSGATTTHRYAAAGSYPVSLTVTDDDGASATTTRTVTPTEAPATPPPFAADRFERTMTGGFGIAEAGGAWRTSGWSSTAFAVSGGAGRVRVPAGAGADVSLPAVSSATTDLSMALAVDRVPTGGGLYASLGVRRVAGAGEYRTKVHLRANGSVTVTLLRTALGAETPLASTVVVPGLTYAAGERILVRTQATGTSPTTVAARVWKAGTPEPTTWQVSRLDTTTGLQVAGSIGANLYLSGSATNGPVEVALDDVVGRAP